MGSPPTTELSPPHNMAEPLDTDTASESSQLSQSLPIPPTKGQGCPRWPKINHQGINLQDKERFMAMQQTVHLVPSIISITKGVKPAHIRCALIPILMP